MPAGHHASAHSDRAKSVDIPAIIVEWNRRVRHESSLSRLVDARISHLRLPRARKPTPCPRVRLAAAEVCSVESHGESLRVTRDLVAGDGSIRYREEVTPPHDVPQTHGDNERPGVCSRVCINEAPRS